MEKCGHAPGDVLFGIHAGTTFYLCGQAAVCRDFLIRMNVRKVLNLNLRKNGGS